MATKSSTLTAVSPSTQGVQVDLLIADDFRTELTGKVTGVGLYPDRVIVLLVPPGAPAPSAESPVALDGAFLINIRNLLGEHEVSVDLGGNSKTHTISFVHPGASVNLVGRFRPLLVQSFGVKTITIKVDGTAFPRTFEIRRGDVVPVAPVKVATRQARAKKTVKPRVKSPVSLPG